jgi:hypothetical protein
MDGMRGRGRTAAGGFLTHRRLIGFAAGTAMAEAATLALLAPAARALAPQVTALPPLAIFHDLRWLYSSQRSWPGFCLALGGLVAVRAAVNALLARLAWPARAVPPRLPPLLATAAGAALLGYLLMSPVVSLTLGVAILPFSWPFLAMLPTMLLIALPLSHAGTTRAWWRLLPPPSAMGWLVAEFALMSAAAALTAITPVLAAVPIAGLAGLVNARAWYGVTAAAALAPAPGPARPVARAARIPAMPLAVAIVITAVVALTRLVFVLATLPGPDTHGGGVAWLPAGPAPARPLAPAAAAAAAGAKADPVLEVAGFGSSCCSHDQALAKVMPGTPVEQFSYRGMSRAGDPLPAGPTASDVGLRALGDRMAAQVWRLYRDFGQRVDIVAESEGTLGVDAMLARHPGVPVGSLVLLSPIVAPGQAGHPHSAGVVAGDELRAVVWFVGGLSPFGTSGAQQLIDSVSSDGARFASRAAQDSPLRVLDLVPLADAVTLPVCRLPANVVVVPAFHGELLGDPVALRIVAGFLRHRPLGQVPGLRTTAEIMAAAATAWRMPEPAAPSPPC